MNFITVLKIGNTIHFTINGQLNKKDCASKEEANELFKVALKAKEEPTEENIRKVRLGLNEKTRVAMMAGLECDENSGNVFLAGFNTPIPVILVDVIKDYHENKFPITPIINFWKLLMINPDTRVRTSLFKFIQKHDFVLTDSGYMLVYKAVDVKTKVENDLAEFITNSYLKVKKDWKCSPNKYTVYRENGALAMSKNETVENWLAKKEKEIEVLGKLGDLNAQMDKIAEEQGSLYTDFYSHTMDIRLGMPIKMERKSCDSDPARDCSYGLHVGATKYVEDYYKNNNPTILVCLVNPANVVAVPEYNCSKMRVSEYFPIAVANFNAGKIDIVQQKYFESDYKSHEEAEIEKMIAKVKANEQPIIMEIKAPVDERPMSEMMKILETRLVDIK